MAASQQPNDGPAFFLPAEPPVPATDSVHWLPFGIAYDGPAAAAEQFFAPQRGDEVAAAASTSGSGAVYEARFRGRQLKGVRKQLPAGYSGLLLKPVPSSSSGSDAEQRSWRAAASFGSVTLWCHDAPPVSTDWHVRAIDWLALAEQVHAPVAVEQVEQELQRMQAAGVAHA